MMSLTTKTWSKEEMDEDIIAILLEEQELENDYTLKRKEVNFLHLILTLLH